jgi:GNAT superfamily N-acetyltransferase
MSVEQDLRRLWKAAFGDDDAFLDKFFSTAYSPHRSRYLTENGRITAALYWLDCHTEAGRFAYLYAVATDPAHRGKGLCKTLLAQTHDHLARLGYAGAILVPGEEGLREMYKKMGYSSFSGMDAIQCEAAAPIAVKRASPEEYAAARARLLPCGGVVQEAENLAFLGTYAALYTGDHFTLAAVEEDGRLLGLELLGDPSVASGILGTLGIKDGSFRIPGSAPFAMYRSLDGTPAPAYFGLAFD